MESLGPQALEGIEGLVDLSYTYGAHDTLATYNARGGSPESQKKNQKNHDERPRGVCIWLYCALPRRWWPSQKWAGRFGHKAGLGFRPQKIGDSGPLKNGLGSSL